MVYTLDARRLLCPLPVIRLQSKMKELQSGDVLHIVCTDPGTLYDIPTWCRIHGHRLLETQQTDREIMMSVQVG